MAIQVNVSARLLIYQFVCMYTYHSVCMCQCVYVDMHIRECVCVCLRTHGEHEEHFPVLLPTERKSEKKRVEKRVMKREMKRRGEKS